MTSRRTLAIALTAATPVLAAAGCGNTGEGSDKGSPVTGAPSARSTEGPAPAGRAQSQTIRVTGTDFRLNPAQVQAPRGKVKFEFVNQGQVTHALEVEGPAGEEETEELEAGGRGSFTIDLSEPGTYVMYCPVGSHRQQGMEGKVVVR